MNEGRRNDGDATLAAPLTVRVLAVAAAATVASLLLLPAHAVRFARTTADEPQYLLTAISLAEDRDLDIADELDAARWRPFHAPDLPPQTEPSAGGIELSPHDPGLPVLLAAPVALGGWAGAKVALAACSGVLAAIMLWVAVRRLGVRVGVATAGTLAFGVAPPLAVYGAQVYPELPAAACVAGVVALAGAHRHRRAALAGVVALTTVTAWLSVKYVPAAGVLVALVLAERWRRDERRDAAVAAGASCVLGLVYLVAHQRWYGGLTPYASGDFFAEHGGQLSVMGDRPNHLARTQRVSGLLVDRDVGLAAWQPAWLLVVPALGALLVRRPPRWAMLAAPLAAGWAVATWVAVTMHGWWWPGRHVVHVLPCAVLAIVWWLGRLDAGRALAWAAAVIGALSTVWLAAGASLADLTLVYDPWRTTSPVHRAVRPLLPDLRADRLAHDVLAAAWAVALVGLAAWAARRERGVTARSVLDDVVAEPVPQR